MNPWSGSVHGGLVDINSGLFSGAVLLKNYGESGMNIKMLTGVVLGCCIGGAAAAGGALSGSKLFEYHGCNNCHGDNGSSPVSHVVPSLAGKPADTLYAKGKRILSGKGETQESGLMHAALYSPSQCDSPPTDVELRQITIWLSDQ